MGYSTEEKRRKRAPLDMSDWLVIYDWPKPVPVSPEEIHVFDAYFGDILDELFPHTAYASLGSPRGTHVINDSESGHGDEIR